MACGFHQMMLLAMRVGGLLFWTCPVDLMLSSDTLWERCLSLTNQGKDKTKQRTSRYFCDEAAGCGVFLGLFKPITCCRKASS